MSALILASASPGRAQILRNAGVSFDVVPARVDEEAMKDSLLANKTPHQNIADALAEMKAIKISNAHPAAMVLGADQVLSFQGRLVSKCADMTSARALLASLRGHSHDLYSAVVLAKGGQPVWRHVAKASLWMRNTSDALLDEYLAQGGQDLLGRVGCYGIEDRGIQLFERIEGDYFSILGLPLLPVLNVLRQHGVLPT